MTRRPIRLLPIALLATLAVLMAACGAVGVPLPEIQGGGSCGNGRIDPGEGCDGGVEPYTCEEWRNPEDDGTGPRRPPICYRGGCDTGSYCNDSCECEVAYLCGDGIVDLTEAESCEPVTSWTDPAGEVHLVGEDGVAPRSNCEPYPGTTCNPQSCRCEADVVLPVAGASPVCGNGVVEAGEACDGGVPEGRCRGPFCDRGGCPAPTYCGADCTCGQPQATCGDGVLEQTEGEECDTNNPCSGGLFCNPVSCLCEGVAVAPAPGAPPEGPVCGNGIIEQGEACDTLGCTGGRVCGPNCQCVDFQGTPACGNGVVEPGEQCEDFGSSNTCGPDLVCSQQCRCVVFSSPYCGDGTCGGNENEANCPADCGVVVVGPVCGNGACEDGETPGNCLSDCPIIVTICGNGTCESAENVSNCPADCAIVVTVCGNGTCESGENTSNCAVDCGIVVAPFCGDGTCNGGETRLTCPGDCPITINP